MIPPADLTPFQGLVREKCGLSFDAYHPDTLASAIRGRMAQHGLGGIRDYYDRVTRDRLELEALVSLLTVNETYFMREEVHFELLSRKLIGELLPARRSADPVRVLVAGCSTGEEAYSVMISLLERHGTAIGQSVSVVGVDIDSRALERAQLGVYAGFSFRALPEPLRQKYFERLGVSEYQIRDDVKQAVRFMPLNLASDEYPAMLAGLDFIFYRNVSIYFDAPAQKRVFRKLASLLREGGWLFVSSTETLTHDVGVLTLEEVDGVFCYRNAQGLSFGDRRKTGAPLEAVSPVQESGEVSAAPGPSRPAEPLPQPRTPPRAARPAFDTALALAKQKLHDEALACIDQAIESEPSFVKAYMLKAGILANLKRIDDARRCCLAALEKDRWNLEAHLLLGLLARMEDDEESALRRFREAVYIQPSCWLAHFHLAQIFTDRRETANARREYGVVIRLLARGSIESHGLTFFPLAFPADQIMHLCRHNLAKLDASQAR